MFNGEIYNYQELRLELLSKGHTFKTKTDTEVIVHLYEEFGESCVQKLRGMFAFAIWDERQKTLFLARDRVGIKPLYYWLSDKSFVFGSEIKAILASGMVPVRADLRGINHLFTFFALPGPVTCFDGISSLALFAAICAGYRDAASASIHPPTAPPSRPGLVLPSAPAERGQAPAARRGGRRSGLR